MIVISEFMDAAAVDRLRADFEVHHDATLVDDPATIVCSHQVCRSTDRAESNAGRCALLANAPRLRVVGRLGVGLDNIDTAACAARAIEVIPATGANAIVGRRICIYDRDAAAAWRLRVIGRSRRGPIGRGRSCRKAVKSAARRWDWSALARSVALPRSERTRSACASSPMIALLAEATRHGANTTSFGKAWTRSSLKRISFRCTCRSIRRPVD